VVPATCLPCAPFGKEEISRPVVPAQLITEARTRVNRKTLPEDTQKCMVTCSALKEDTFPIRHVPDSGRDCACPTAGRVWGRALRATGVPAAIDSYSIQASGPSPKSVILITDLCSSPRDYLGNRQLGEDMVEHNQILIGAIRKLALAFEDFALAARDHLVGHRCPN
jgi:hypothetical protein